MAPPLLAGNWKMNGSRVSVGSLLSTLKEYAIATAGQMAVFPPFPFLQQVSSVLHNTKIMWGAQNVCAHENGAFTGEVSAAMLVDFGCRFVIVGHSERRLLYGEDDLLVAKKCQRALAHGLTPILCVGETQKERENNLTQAVITRQLLQVIEVLGVESLANIVLAYEPVWAIGTGLTASPQEVEAVHVFLKQKIAEKNAIIAQDVQIIYGGSLKAANATALFTIPHVNGGLVGGASLEAGEFLKIFEILVHESLFKISLD